MEHNKLDTTRIIKYLKQVEEAKNEAIKAIYDLAEQRTTSKKLIAAYQQIFGSKNNSNDMIATDLIKLEELKHELELKRNNWKQKREEIKNFIETLNLSSREKAILNLKYVCNKNSTEIGIALGISARHINRTHSMVLEKISKLYR